MFNGIYDRVFVVDAGRYAVVSRNNSTVVFLNLSPRKIDLLEEM